MKLEGLIKYYARKKDKEKIKELEEINRQLLNAKIGVDLSYNDYIPKSLLKEKLEEIKQARNLAQELITNKVVIADSDSLYSGERIAHDYDINILEKLLGDDYK